MEANAGSQWPEDYGIAMVVSSDGLVAWVPAQAMAQYGGRGALVAAALQDAWVPAEAAARTGWIPPPGMLYMEGDHARAVALRHGWAQGPRTGFAAGDVLYHACLCLPSQEVARTRRVCRLWRAKTNEEAFHLRHRDHRCRMPMPLFRFEDPRDLAGFNLRAVDIRDCVSRPVIRFNGKDSQGAVAIHGSCAGILLVSYGDSILYVGNPSTRRWQLLPPLHVTDNIIGFYATTGRGDFGCNVLYHDRHETDCSYWIFTIGTATSMSLRRIDGLYRGVANLFELPPVLLLNRLHWLPRSAQDKRYILRFDTVAETFSMIPPPSTQVGNHNYPVQGGCRQLFEIDQNLAMTVKFPLFPRVDVWVRSNTTGLWSFRYFIRLPVDEINLAGISHGDVRVFAVAQDRNVLVCCPRILLQCDAQGNVLGRYKLAGHDTILAGHTIEESLLLHPSILRMQPT